MSGGKKTENLPSNVGFTDPTIIKFWDNISSIPSEFREAARCILTILDRDGDVPSIVGAFSKYRYLGDITLTNHTINVANNIMDCFDRHTPQYNVAVIAALGHDIAKCSDQLDRKNYTTVNHARLSATILHFLLSSVLTEKQLTTIVEAVKYHHNFYYEKPILMALKSSDKKAREAETLQIGVSLLEKGICDLDKSFYFRTRLEPNPRRHKTDISEKKLQQLHRPDPKRLNMEWFYVDDYLHRLKEQINRQYKKWPDAFSMKDWICYFSPEVIFDVLEEMARDVIGWSMEYYRQERRVKLDVIAFVGEALRKKGALADELLQGPTFYFNTFILNYHRGYPDLELSLLPVRGECFTTNITFLEVTKKNTMLDRIRSVHVKYKLDGKSE